MKSFLFLWFVLLPFLGGFVSCSNQIKAKQPVSYHFQSGRTVLLRDGKAYAPKNAPAAVKRAVAAGNRLQTMSYRWGGGHGGQKAKGYDCSGSVSYVLREAGLLKGSIGSKEYFRYGKKGEGKWITLYIRNGHVFMTVAGLRLDTGGPGEGVGPRWKPEMRRSVGHVMRHPDGC